MRSLDITLMLIGLASLTAQIEAQCPDGWMNHGDMCYHFSHDKENWIDAQVVCEHFGGFLAEINSQYEDNFLLQEAIRRKGDFWIGASDLSIGNEWVWYESNTKVGYNNWGNGEPNNQRGTENCVEIRYSAKDWNDRPCSSYQTWYICQKGRGDIGEIIG